MSFGAAANRLKKQLLYKFVVMAGQATCYRCSKPIESVDEFSIEHRNSWQLSADPRSAFFDLDNITFSHLGCNCGEPNRRKSECPQGHRYDDVAYVRERTSGQRRECRECERTRCREYYRSLGPLGAERVREYRRRRAARAVSATK